MRKLINFLIVIVIIGLCICGYKIFSKLREYKVSDDLYKNLRENYIEESSNDETELNFEKFSNKESKNKITETESENNIGKETEEEIKNSLVKKKNFLQIDWDALNNKDIVAWLEFKDISYPVMYSEIEDYYLHRLPDGSYNYGGSLFLYSKNNPLFTDSNSFIYGHNMHDGSMFGSLKKYLNEESKGKKFYLYLPDGTRHTYEIFAMKGVASKSELYTWYFGTPKKFLEWQNAMLENSVVSTELKPDIQGKFVTLSTCNGEAGTSYRLLVCGKEILVE